MEIIQLIIFIHIIKSPIVLFSLCLVVVSKLLLFRSLSTIIFKILSTKTLGERLHQNRLLDVIHEYYFHKVSL